MCGPFKPSCVLVLVLACLLVAPPTLQTQQGRDRGAKCNNPRVRTIDMFVPYELFKIFG